GQRRRTPWRAQKPAARLVSLGHRQQSDLIAIRARYPYVLEVELAVVSVADIQRGGGTSEDRSAVNRGGNGIILAHVHGGVAGVAFDAKRNDRLGDYGGRVKRLSGRAKSNGSCVECHGSKVSHRPNGF